MEADGDWLFLCLACEEALVTVSMALFALRVTGLKHLGSEWTRVDEDNVV